MRKLKIGKLAVVAFVLVALIAGCGREQAPSPAFPAVVATIPVNGATGVLLNTTVTATFNTVMNPATINTTTFTLTGPGAVAVAGAVSFTGRTATFTPAASLAASTVYVATITTGAKDPAGNSLAANFVWSFTTGLPTIISTVPAAGAAAVLVNTLVSATFSEPMDPLTVNNATFTLTGPGATPVAGMVTYAGSTATFTPSAVLANSTLFTATITTGAKDFAGAGLAANFVWTFTTAPPPTVNSTVPADGATVAVNTLISATFSEAMNATTINGTNFTVTGPGATPVAGAVTYSGTTATFTPTTVLANSTLFTATITTGAKDPAGAPLAANFVWTFTTAPPPTVISTTPLNGAAGVAKSTTVTATFSVPMDAATINATTFTVMGPGATAVAGSVTYAGNTATFTPAALLAGSTLYTATITSGAKDPTGAPLAANVVWTFTTAPTPAVTATVPASEATNVPLNQKITATFNTPMTASTITAAGTFTVAVTTGGAAVPGTVTYDAASKTAIFAPTAALTASTQYTATVTTAAQSIPGDALAASHVWSFTTGCASQSANRCDVQHGHESFYDFSGRDLHGDSDSRGSRSSGHCIVCGQNGNLYANRQSGGEHELHGHDYHCRQGSHRRGDGREFCLDFYNRFGSQRCCPDHNRHEPGRRGRRRAYRQNRKRHFQQGDGSHDDYQRDVTLAVAGSGAVVNGTVVYDSASQLATFMPSANLAASTQYTATVSNAVTDLSGNPLAAGLIPNPWSFTTGTVAGGGASPATINLGSAASFAVMATSSISSTGPVVINGDVGLQPGTSQGIPPAQVNGTIHVNDPVVTQAQADLLAAYNDAVSRSTNAQTLPGNMGGLTFTPGLYVNSTSVLISGAGPGNNVTLDARGDPNAVFIFKMGSTLTTGTASQVILAGGAKAGNVFWQVGTSATIDTTSIFKGNVLAAVSITLNTGVVAEGRMFAGSAGGAASATVNASTVTVPAP